MYKTFDPEKLTTPELHGLLLSAVAPRPIALASTINAGRKVNLSPFSFFNVFSSNPPILIFSPSRRVRDNSTKDTLDNVLVTKEVCISIVNYAMVQQISLASTEYPKGVNEFLKSGLTEAKSSMVKPPYVAEAPVSFECKVIEVKALGFQGGAGNLVIAEVVLIHVDEAILNKNGMIDPLKLDPVARMGGDWYSKLAPETIFTVEKPLSRLGIGIDQLPEHIKNSKILTGNDLARLANVESIPTQEELLAQFPKLKAAVVEIEQHREAQQALKENNLRRAWAILLR